MKLPFTNVLRWGKLQGDQVYKREDQLLVEIVAKSDWTEGWRGEKATLVNK